MYGQGYPAPPASPQQRVPASVIVLRVLFAVLPLLSLGMLTWVTALRIGLLTRRVVDWVLLGVSVAVIIATFVLLPNDENDTSLRGDLVIGMVLLSAIAFAAYYLVVDIQHDHTRPRAYGPAPVPPPYNPYAATVPQHHQAYGYPQPQPHPQPRSAAAPPVAPPQPVRQPQPQPQPLTPPSPRIHQVRAELDELSDLLRKDERK
ncbi:hypothetical protein [Streptomyces sp. NPDC127114]|uniref:hypothetical protein n=1 Tax=Streptomyces sp. NPDC127114 TaxID=3345366 RepID=UPI00362E45CD